MVGSDGGKTRGARIVVRNSDKEGLCGVLLRHNSEESRRVILVRCSDKEIWEGLAITNGPIDRP